MMFNFPGSGTDRSAGVPICFPGPGGVERRYARRNHLKVQLGMQRIILKMADEPGNDACTVCGESTLWNKGPRLVTAEGGSTICRHCGRRHAASLAALLDLANVADKVGRQCRHLLTPPMESLLDLARAAENYSTSTPRRRAVAG